MRFPSCPFVLLRLIMGVWMVAIENQVFGNNEIISCARVSKDPSCARGYVPGDGHFCREHGLLLLRPQTQCHQDHTIWWECWRRRRFKRWSDLRFSLSHDSHGPACTDAELAVLDMGIGRNYRATKSTRTLPGDLWEKGATTETVTRLCDQGHLAEAVEGLGFLVQTESCISKSVFYSVLKICMGKRDLVLGRRVHAFTVKKGYQSDTFLCNHILRMYAAHGRLQDAMDVFTLVAQPDAFMWSSIISAYCKHGEDKEAILLYHKLRRSSVEPDGHTFVAALQACGRGSDLKTGKEVHADVLASGLEPHLFVWNSLVDMYAKCGSLEDAQMVFDGLGSKDVVTWNAMIGGYCQQGLGHEALCLYSRMQNEGNVAPDFVTFVCLLQACAGVGALALEKGKQLHAQIRELGHEDDVFVANSLVNMYAKCGSLEDARRVFEGLSTKDEVTWTALIAGYSQQGMGQEALRQYCAMQEEGIAVPNSVTFVCLLQACAGLGTPALETGKQLHTQIRELGYQGDAFVASSLLQMYAKCGSLEDAQRVFDGFVQKDVVSWNCMIGQYSMQGMEQEALHLYGAMQDDGMAVPNSVTFLCLLQACASLGTPALEKGKQLHTKIREQGHQEDVYISTSLVNMYAKCGSLVDARRVFDRLVEKDVVTWNVMIAGYSQQGMGHEALCLFRRMQEEGIAESDSRTFMYLLQACASVGSPALGMGMQLHTKISEQGLQDDVGIASSLVTMYAKCGSIGDARSLFDGLIQNDVGTWNAMIAAYSQQGLEQEALRLYRVMEEEGTAVPNSLTFLWLLQACASLGPAALEVGKQLHAQIRGGGHEADVIVANNLVNMYAKCGSLKDSQSVFDGLGQKDVVTWTSMIAGFSQQGLGQEALHLYDSMLEEGIAVPNSVTFVCLLQACASIGTPAVERGRQLHEKIIEQGHQADTFVANSLVNMYAKCGSMEEAARVFHGLGQKDVVTWTALIAGYSHHSMAQNSLSIYRAMQDEGIAVPDSMTFVCLLEACANVGALHLGRQLHAQIEEQGLQSDAFVACSLIDMYGHSGSMVDAQQVFEELPERTIVVWNALVAGYSRQGDSQEVFHLILRMKREGIRPDAITSLCVLTVCSHRGLVSKGQEYFDAMSKDYGIVPTVEHYACLVDLLGRAGQLDEAIDLVNTMPVRPEAAVWRTLLGACQKWSNVDVGRRALDQAVKLDETDSAAHVLMLNIYANAQMWEQAQKMQTSRTALRAWKQPGQSWWTDVDGQVHSFVVGSTKHALS